MEFDFSYETPMNKSVNKMQNILRFKIFLIFGCGYAILHLQCYTNIKSINQASQYELSSDGRSYHKLMVNIQNRIQI